MRRPFFSSPRGQTIVEFALLTPILLVLLIGIIDFSAAMNRRIVLQHAAREGARMAAVNNDAAEVCAYTCDQAKGAVNGPITFQYTDRNDPPNSTVTDAGDNVELTLPAEWELPLINNALGIIDNPIPPIPLTAKGSARLERGMSAFPQCTCP